MVYPGPPKSRLKFNGSACATATQPRLDTSNSESKDFFGGNMKDSLFHHGTLKTPPQFRPCPATGWERRLG